MLLWSIVGLTVGLFLLQISMQLYDTWKNIRIDRATLALLNTSLASNTEQSIDALLRAHPDDIQPYLRWAQFAADQGDHEEAARRTAIIRTKFPKKRDGFTNGAKALLACGKRAEAEALIALALKKFGRSAELIICRAHLAHNALDAKLATERFAELRRLYPDVPDGYVWGAESLARLGKHAEAEALLQHGIDGPLQNRWDTPLIRYATYSSEREDWQEAARRWKLLAESHPFKAEGYLGQSEALRRCGQWTKAERVMQSAKTFCPRDSRVDVEAGLVEAQEQTAGFGQGIATTTTADVGAALAGDNLATPPLTTVMEMTAATEFNRHMHAAADALHDGNLTEAHREWALARQSQDAPPEPWLLAAEHAEPDDALALLHEAAQRFPLAGPVQLALARAAERRSDWPIAEQAWRSFVAAEPDTWWGFIELAEALRKQDRFDEADLALLDGCNLLPDAAMLPIWRAQLAQLQESWHAAYLRWNEVTAKWPDRPEGVIGRAISLSNLGSSEAYAALSAAAEQFPDRSEPLEHLARLAERQENWVAAERSWRGVITIQPNIWWAYDGLATSLLNQEKLDEAEAILANATKTLPNEAIISELYARFAERRGNFAVAAQRWQEVIERFPGNWMGYRGRASALSALGCTEEADTLLRDAAPRFPEHPDAYHDIAHVAERCEDWVAAEHAWRAFLSIQGPTTWAFVALSRALIRQQRLEDADKVLQEAMQHFPGDASAFIESAFNAQNRRNWTMALQRWQLVRSRFPQHGLIPMASVLRELGEYQQAEILLEEAIAHNAGDPTAFVDYALIAHARGDWAAAAERWEQLRADFPLLLIAYTQGARALSGMRRYDEAEVLLQSAAAQFPDEIDPLIELAFLAHIRRDLSEALLRWKTVRERAPEVVMAYTFAALDLRYLGRFDEADRLLAETIERFPNEPSAQIDAAMLCHERRDWDAALARWATVRHHFPDQLPAYTFAAIAARECQQMELAESLLQTAIEKFPGEAAPAVDLCWLAHQRHDLQQALERWELVRKRFPERSEGYVGAAAALRALGHEADAEALLTDGEARNPTLSAIAVERAWLPVRRHDLADATSRFEVIRSRFPDEPAGYIGGATVLTSQGQLSQAEQLLEVGMARLPEHPELALEHAQLPVVAFLLDKRDWPEAIRRCNAMCARFPEFEPGLLATIRVLRDAQRLDEAEAFTAEASKRLPRSSYLATEYARMALARGAWDEAISRFTDTRDRFPGAVDTYVGLAEALSRVARYDEAETVLQTAMERFPARTEPFAEFALVASRRNDLKLALDRWIAAQQRFPQDEQMSHRVFEAKLRLTETDSADDIMAAGATGANPGSAGEKPLREMILDFESLGGTLLGCEFGLLQRALGAEPLGLLRWSEMSIEQITDALNAKFEGVGLPENTELIIPEQDGRLEYTLQDRRFGMTTHTFIARDDAVPDKLFKQLCRRQQYLKDKLIEDLSANSKIFVFKITLRNLTTAELTSLREAMQGFGNNSLLYVRYADSEHCNGTVEVAAPGLMIGYIDRFARGRDGEQLAPATLSWTTICERAHQLWRSGAVNGGGIETGRVSGAKAILTPHFVQVPDDGSQFIEHARLMERLGDWPQALEQWTVAASRLPDRWEVYQGRAQALRQLGHHSDARQVLTDAADRFPDVSHLWHDLAWLEEIERNWAGAADGWRRFISLQPDHWRGYTGLANALREQQRYSEADAVLANQLDRLPSDAILHCDYARLAEWSGNWPDALVRWTNVAGRFPAIVDGYLGQAKALREQGNFPCASEILGQTEKSFPDDPAPPVELAKLAALKCEWTEAVQRYSAIIERFPNHQGMREELANAALWAKNLELAEQLAAEVRASTPLQVVGWFIAIASMRARGASAEADVLMTTAPAEVRNHHDVMSIWVTLPRSCQDWTEQLRRAQLMFELYPDSAKSFMHIIYSHSFVGDLAEAKRYATQARSRWPDDLGLMQADADIAIRKGAWTEALPLLQRMVELAPDEESYRNTYDHVRRQAAA